MGSRSLDLIENLTSVNLTSVNLTSVNLTSDEGMDDLGSNGMTVMEWIMTILKATLGSVAAFQNAVIFILLCMKKKRVVS